MNDVIYQYTQYKCRPYVGDETQTSNSKALLAEPLRPLVMDKKKQNRGLIGFLLLLKLAGFDRQEKSILETPQWGKGGSWGGGWGGVGWA